jgi:hypothetical protein
LFQVSLGSGPWGYHLKLEVGQTTESIAISGEAIVLEGSNPSIAMTLEKRAPQDPPTPPRNVFFLSAPTPSVIPTGDPQFERRQDQTNSPLLSPGVGPRRANHHTQIAHAPPAVSGDVRRCCYNRKNSAIVKIPNPAGELIFPKE